MVNCKARNSANSRNGPGWFFLTNSANSSQIGQLIYNS
jgi:hypothetical protein